MSLIQGRIDVHHHIIPPAFTDAMQRRGLSHVAGAPLPRWTPQDSINIMDTVGTQTAIVSLSAPGVYFDDLPDACRLATACNEYAAQMREDYPQRFGFFAVLPMPFTEESCKEAIYALDVLQADGIVLLGSTQGVFLGDPRFEELMVELNARKAVVFIHPNMHQSSVDLGLKTPGYLLEFLCDTTRAAVNLIVSGVMERYPNIQWILSHAGGFLPYIAWRLSLGNLLPEVNAQAPQGMLTYIRRFYFDTALSASPYAMSALQQLVDPSHILFGSDFPFAPAPLSALQVKSLDDLSLFDASTLSGIYRGHALSLFPKYQQDQEVITPRPIYQQEAMSSKLRRMMLAPVVNLAEKARKR